MIYDLKKFYEWKDNIIFLRRLSSKDDILSICSQFEICEAIGEFQNIIGAIDGTHFILNEAPAQDLTALFTRKKRYVIQSKYIEGDDYVLGDSAYPISSFLITPFKNPFNHRQCQFNFIYSKHRVVVEYAFGKLKAKFKALKELSVKDIKTAIKLAD
ncbi:hypothetical protein RhiirB3_458483, partial [Rhizophagus irregularis]